MVQAAAIHVARYAFYIPTGEYRNVALEALSYEDRVAAIDASVGLVKTIFQICAIVGMFGATLLMPALMRKIDYKKLLIYTCIAGAVSSVFTTLIGWFADPRYALYICIPFIIISSIFCISAQN
mgnify:CR=1 FL=1